MVNDDFDSHFFKYTRRMMNVILRNHIFPVNHIILVCSSGKILDETLESYYVCTPYYIYNDSSVVNRSSIRTWQFQVFSMRAY